MKKLPGVMAYLIYAIGLLIIYILPANKYYWMHQLDSSLQCDSIKDPSGDSALFVSLILMIIIAPQLIILAITKGRKEKIAALALILLAIVVWLFKLKF